jgi:hypothetical protein
VGGAVNFVTPSQTTASSGGGGAVAVVSVLGLVLTILIVAADWRIYTKAGRHGWAVLIPIYNVLVLLRIVGRHWWWLLLLLIPFVDIIVWIILINDVSKAFGKGVGFTLGLLFLPLIFFPILGFGSARYLGPPNALGALPPSGYAPR